MNVLLSLFKMLLNL
jgi:hypothetical protein